MPMMNCTPITKTGPPPSQVKKSQLFLGNNPHHPLFCLIIAVFCMATALLGTVNASYDPQFRRSGPFLFNNSMYSPTPPAGGYSETGVASWYGRGFHGKRTSSGERYDVNEMTAAHRQLPMDTLLLVKNLENGRETIVRVNDRGPFVKGRILDLSQSAAKALKLEGKGTARVTVVALSETGRPVQIPPQDQPLDASDGSFYVQVGAFTREMNAEHMQKRFSDAGHTTTVSKVSGKKATIYRVLIFAGRDLSKALLAKRTLQQNGHKGAFVLTR